MLILHNVKLVELFVLNVHHKENVKLVLLALAQSTTFAHAIKAATISMKLEHVKCAI